VVASGKRSAPNRMFAVSIKPGTNTLAYYGTATIVAVKSFIVQAPGFESSSLVS